MDMFTVFPAAQLLPYMPDVAKYERSLHDLNLMWRMIEVSAKMGCPVEASKVLPTLTSTCTAFSQLEGELITSLAQEKASNVLAEMATKSRYVIDIVVRNLYERTADVGFLATDLELCSFVAGLGGDLTSIRERLASYCSKYTVYAEIILLDVEGQVLAQVDEQSPLARMQTYSRDPLIAATLASEGYVETFRPSDLRPGRRNALIYSRRMYHPLTGGISGVLCLCFRFEEEMARIFLTHRDIEERAIMLLLDGDDRVVASADPVWVPLGAKVPVNRQNTPAVLKYAGRDYMVRTAAALGYQGYGGPAGWQGQVMIPVDVAFGNSENAVLASLAPEWVKGLLSYAPRFCPPLQEIIRAADMIRRVVWNGQVIGAGQVGDVARLRSILEQIGETGAKSDTLFSRSINELFQTVLALGLNEAEFSSRLMVDLLDRNLYERANDCRWWALSPELRIMLAGTHPDRAERIAQTLAYIHGLYTVYTALIVYDHAGKIVAHSGACGVSAIDDETLAAVHALRTEQDYYSTPFGPSELYGGRPTFVYHAAIRASGDSNVIIGGIAIVFDAATEFKAMLHGALSAPSVQQGYFVDRAGTVLASTDPRRAAGEHVELPPHLASLEDGRSASCSVTHDGHYAIMGATVANGYREFKVSDDKASEVLAVVVRSFGPVCGGGQIKLPPKKTSTTTSGADHGVAYATFVVGDTLFALEASEVCEAWSAVHLTPMTLVDGDACVGMLQREVGTASADFVWVYDLGFLIDGCHTVLNALTPIIVVRHGPYSLGLLVSELHGVPSFSEDAMMVLPFAQQHGATVRGLLNSKESGVLIQLLDIKQLITRIECLVNRTLSRN